MGVTRSEAFLKGVKVGAIKNGVEKVTAPISGPVADAINEKLQEIHPNTKLAAPMVDSAIKCAIIMGFAELLDVAAPYVGDRTNYDPKKINLASEFMREFAGEKMGHEVVDLALQFVPIIMTAFAEVSVSDLQDALTDDSDDFKVVTEDLEQHVEDVFAVPKLEEEPAPVPKKKRGRPRKKVHKVQEVQEEQYVQAK